MTKVTLQTPKKKQFTPEVAAEILDTSVGTLSIWLKSGDLRCMKIGNTIKIYETELDDFIQKHQGEQFDIKAKVWKPIAKK